MIVYADSRALADWMGTAESPDNADQLLRSASLLVLQATAGAFYDADAVTSLPTDATTLQAFKDATCSQAAAMSTLGVNPLAGGNATSSGVVSSKDIGSGKLVYADAAAAVRAKVAASQDLVPEAYNILAAAGLTSSHVWQYG